MAKRASFPVDASRLEAVVFDVDGTLYRQLPVRVTMLLKLLGAHMTRPAQGLRVLRVLNAYRNAHETLRDGDPGADLASRQLELACASAGVSSDVAASLVARWMEREPLPVLARWGYEGVGEFVTAARSRGIKLGVLSDYPARDKLSALGLEGKFDVVMSAQDPAVGALKPHPKGLQAVLGRLGVEPARALYVGDRPDLDGGAATSAGMACVIIGGGKHANGAAGWVPVRNFVELRDVLL